MKRKTTKTKTTTAFNNRLKKLNDKYNAATPVEQRKMIARDCLEQIKAERYRVSRGVFSEVVVGHDNDGERVLAGTCEPLQPLLHKPKTTCDCCGVGAVFLSYVRLANVATASEGHGVYDIHAATQWPLENLKLIELAFERGSGACRANTDDEFKAAGFAETKERPMLQSDTRLKAILNNIIKAPDGLFHP